MELARVNKASEAVVEVLTEFLPASETERGAGGTSVEGDMAMDPAERCASVLSGLMATKAARWFLQPVTPKEAPDYEEYVSSPMDYGTIKAKLEAGQYASPEDFAADVRLVTANAIKYSPDNDNYVNKDARACLTAFERAFDKDSQAAAAAEKAQKDAKMEVAARARRERPIRGPGQMQRCAEVLALLTKLKTAVWFLEPVAKWEAKDYEEYVSSPMDYGTIKAKLEAGQYASPEDFAADVRLVTANAIRCTSHFTRGSGPGIYAPAEHMLHMFHSFCSPAAIRLCQQTKSTKRRVPT